MRDVSLPNGLTPERISRRREALLKIDTLQRDLETRPEALQAIDSYYENAFSMITSASAKTAFDLGQEDDNTRDAYGRHNLGQSCLLARRLIESGCRFVTVTSGGWDTHRDNFNGLKKLLPPLDQAWPALLTDLEDRGLLENTFVVWLTDFGRTPIINSAAGRDHWSTASIATFAGAGVRGGQILGKNRRNRSTTSRQGILPGRHRCDGLQQTGHPARHAPHCSRRSPYPPLHRRARARTDELATASIKIQHRKPVVNWTGFLGFAV